MVTTLLCHGRLGHGQAFMKTREPFSRLDRGATINCSRVIFGAPFAFLAASG
jgi:hypothetical protein